MNCYGLPFTLVYYQNNPNSIIIKSENNLCELIYNCMIIPRTMTIGIPPTVELKYDQSYNKLIISLHTSKRFNLYNLYDVITQIMINELISEQNIFGLGLRNNIDFPLRFNIKYIDLKIPKRKTKINPPDHIFTDNPKIISINKTEKIYNIFKYEKWGNKL